MFPSPHPIPIASNFHHLRAHCPGEKIKEIVNVVALRAKHGTAQNAKRFYQRQVMDRMRKKLKPGFMAQMEQILKERIIHHPLWGSMDRVLNYVVDIYVGALFNGAVDILRSKYYYLRQTEAMIEYLDHHDRQGIIYSFGDDEESKEDETLDASEEDDGDGEQSEESEEDDDIGSESGEEDDDIDDESGEEDDDIDGESEEEGDNVRIDVDKHLQKYYAVNL